MSDQTKVTRLGRGGTPYIRIPDHVNPDDATVMSKDDRDELEWWRRNGCEQSDMDKLRKAVSNSKARIAELEKQLATAQAVIRDDCENDADIRKIAEPYTDVEGDSYGVPPLPDIVESLTLLIDGLREDRHLLDSILATMHRDGGHYQDEHGTTKAVQDAIRKWHDRTTLIADLESQVEASEKARKGRGDE